MFSVYTVLRSNYSPLWWDLSDKGQQNQTPAHHHREHFFHTNTMPSKKCSCESYKETESKNSLEYFVGIWRKRCKWFTRAPPVLTTISHILRKSQQTQRKKESRLCNRAAARYSMSWRNGHQISNAVSLTALKYAVTACTNCKFYWNYKRPQ